MGLAEIIEEAKTVYAAAGLNCGDGLLAPAEEHAIDAIAAKLALPVPEELRNLYRTHGGQDYISPGITGLFGSHRLLTPSQLVEQQLMISGNCDDYYPEANLPRPEYEWPYWDYRLLPFASWDAYDLCIHADSGNVWEFEPYSGLMRRWPNIEAVLSEAVAAVRAGKHPGGIEEPR